MIGNSIYHLRGNVIGTIEGVLLSKEKGVLYQVTGSERYLGVGKIPESHFILVDDNVYLNSTISR